MPQWLLPLAVILVGCATSPEPQKEPEPPAAADPAGTDVDAERGEWLRRKRENAGRERARLESESRLQEVWRKREEEARQREEAEAQERRRVAARAHYAALRVVWSERLRASRKAIRPLRKEFRDAYSRYVDMHAAGLESADEYKLLRATLTRLGSQLLKYDPVRAEAYAVSDALVVDVHHASLPDPRELDEIVEYARAEQRARAPDMEEKMRKVREAFARHLDAPDAAIPAELDMAITDLVSTLSIPD